jgi:hypothetical protein
LERKRRNDSAPGRIGQQLDPRAVPSWHVVSADRVTFDAIMTLAALLAIGGR